MSMVETADNQSLREQLKPAGDEGNTAQGFFIVGADGKFYGWDNYHKTEHIMRFLDEGLERFHANPPAKIAVSQQDLEEHFCIVPEPDTSIVRVYTRIRPVPSGADDLNNSVGRDFLWVLGDETKQISDTAHDDHSEFSLPPNLVARIVRFHMLDNVRGEPDHWQPGEIKDCVFTARMVHSNKDVKSYEFHGKFSQQSRNGKRTFDGTIEGQFEIATNSPKMTKFRALANATASGASRFTPGAPAGRFPVVIAMTEADDPLTKIVPPHALDGWGEYFRAAH